MADGFENFETGLDSPYDNAESITPHDTNDLANTSRGIWTGGPGNLVVIMKGGQGLTFTGVGKGVFLPIRVSRILATGTTATGIIAVW